MAPSYETIAPSYDALPSAERPGCCTNAPTPVPRPPGSPWKTLFFENDFRYLRGPADPDRTPLLGERLKEIPLDFPDGPAFLAGSRLSIGGELRHRYMDENNRLRPGGPGRSTYDLWRWRNYVDFHAGDWSRLYVEMIDAAIFNEDLPATAIDVNRWDIQNAFVDLKVAEWDGRPAYFRAGRQELLYGAQRLVSPLDWANTRRNFEGFKLFRRGESWDLDAFLTRPVNTATGHGPLERFARRRDRPDYSRTFSGVYAVYHGWEAHALDAYWLYLREQEPVEGLKDGSRQTLGLRLAGTVPRTGESAGLWNYDVEGAYQFGHDNRRSVRAGFFTAELGHRWTELPWKPRFSGIYYWGSGDRDPFDGRDNTFSVLFPLGHAYWGLIDNLAGQNLKNYALQVDAAPTAKLSLSAAVHWFHLARDTDVAYNVAGVPLGTPGTGRRIGEELDLLATYTFNPNFSVQAGYFWFWYGTFIERNLPRDTATQFYVQTTLRY